MTPEKSGENSGENSCEVVSAKDRIVGLTLDEQTIGQRSAAVERERAIAIHDLIAQNVFRPCGKCAAENEGCKRRTWSGPFRLHLRVQDRRLVFEISGSDGDEQGCVFLLLAPFRKIVRDYFQICESYYDAVKKHSPSTIETIDAARRGLHDEGALLLVEHLADKIETDHASARRLFMLIAMLYLRL